MYYCKIKNKIKYIELYLLIHKIVFLNFPRVLCTFIHNKLMKASVNSRRQKMVAERFRFGLQGLGLMHCYYIVLSDKKICSTLSLFAQMHKSVLVKLMLVIKPCDRLTSHPDRPIFLPARLIIRTQCFLQCTCFRNQP